MTHPRTIKRADWVDHMLRRNCLLKRDSEGKIEEMVKLRDSDDEDLSSYCRTLRKINDREIKRGDTTG